MPTKPYTVLRITPATRLADAGGIEKYYRVQYRTLGGVVDTVDVDEKDYTEEKLPALLTELAAKHDKMLKL